MAKRHFSSEKTCIEYTCKVSFLFVQYICTWQKVKDILVRCVISLNPSKLIIANHRRWKTHSKCNNKVQLLEAWCFVYLA